MGDNEQTHSANRPCVLHKAEEEEGSPHNGACCSRIGVSAGGRREAGARGPVRVLE